MDDLKNRLKRPSNRICDRRKTPVKYYRIDATQDGRMKPTTEKNKSCCVEGCDGISQGPLSFFKFPDEFENYFVENSTEEGSIREVTSRRRIWEIRLLGGASASDSELVCSKHFEAKFLKTIGSERSRRMILSDSSVPSLNLPPKYGEPEGKLDEIAERSFSADDDWDHEKTVRLLERWSLKRSSTTSLDKNPLVWNQIAEEMQLLGYSDVLGASCYLKVFQLMKRYEELKGELEKPGSIRDVSWRYYFENDNYFSGHSFVSELPKESLTTTNHKAGGLVVRPVEPGRTPIVHMSLPSGKERVKIILKEDPSNSPSQPRNSSSAGASLSKNIPRPSALSRLLDPNPLVSSMTLRPRKTSPRESPQRSPQSFSSDESSPGMRSTDIEIDFEPKRRSRDNPPPWFVEFANRQREEERARADRDAKIISLLERIERHAKEQVEIFSTLRLRPKANKK